MICARKQICIGQHRPRVTFKLSEMTELKMFVCRMQGAMRIKREKKDSHQIEHLRVNVSLENLHSKAFTLIKIALHNNLIGKATHYL